MDDRLSTEIFVSALVRRCAGQGVPAYVARKGASAGGMVVVKEISRERLCRVLSQTRDFDGATAWLAAFAGDTVDEAKAEDYIRRALSRDPDLWVVEVEGPSGLDGKIL